MSGRHAIGCSFPPCEYHKRAAWRFTCARHRGEPERAFVSEREQGRREMLWLMALGAACAEVIYCGLDQGDINGCHDWYDRELVARRVHEVAMEALR